MKYLTHTAVCLSLIIHHTTAPSLSKPISYAAFADTSGTLINTYTITSAGSYYFTQDIVFNPNASNKPALKISANNVRIHLNKHTLSQKSGNTQTGITGVSIDSNLSNVTITDGTIADIKGYGLYINSGASLVHLEQLTIHNTDNDGIAATQAEQCRISHCTVFGANGSASGATQATGLSLDRCHNCEVVNSRFDRNSSHSKESAGIYLITSTSCSFNQCSTNQQSGTQSYGFKITSTSRGCTLDNCQSIGNQATEGNAYGIYDDYGVNNTFNDCRALSSTASDTAVGFYLNNTSHDTCNHCTAISQQGYTANAHGFYSNNAIGNSFLSCTAQGNTASSSNAGVGSGFTLEGTQQYSRIYECRSLTNNGGAGIGYGLYLHGATLCLVENSMFSLNYGTSSIGISDSATQSTNLIMKNVAFGNGTNYAVSFTVSHEQFQSTAADTGDFSALVSANPYDNISITT